MDRPKSERTTKIILRPAFWSIITAIVVTLLVFDGIIHNLPDYDLKKQNTLEIRFFFGAEILVCIACQILFLKIVREKYVSNRETGTLKHAQSLHTIITTVQLVIIALLLAVFIQIEVLNQYYSLTVAIPVVISVFLAISLAGLLAFRFWSWQKFGTDRIVTFYAIAMTLTVVSLIFLAAFISLEMQHAPSIIDSSRIAISTSNITNYALKELNSYLSLASFISLWIASLFLLSFTRIKRRKVAFYVVVTLPMVYYLGIFQWIISIVLSNFNFLNPIQEYTFNLVNSTLTRPIGGVLFGIAFWTVSRGAKEKNVSDYMKLSAFGIVLLSISSVDAGLFNLPYPSFGLPTISFMGLSSYLLFVGIYYSAISVSLDQKLRTSIQKSVETQLRFVSKLGISQMEQEMQKRVAAITKQVAEELEDHSGIESSVPEDIEAYVDAVMKETGKLQNRKNG